MNEDYPVMLRLVGRSCVIVGGGAVAARKAAGLLPTGARITVISPQLDPILQKLRDEGKIAVRTQAYSPGMLRDLQPFLVFASTNDSAVNRLVTDEAQALGALVNISDSSAKSDFMGMSTVQRGLITLALSTGGVSPALAEHLRERVEQAIGEEYATLAAWLAEARPHVQATSTAQPQRAAVWHLILESPILEHLRRGDQTAARTLFDQLIGEGAGNNK